MEDLESLLRGSAVAAAFRRAGGENLHLDELGRPIGKFPRGDNAHLKKMVAELRDDLAAFLEFELANGDLSDQELASRLFRSKLETEEVLGESRLMGIVGLAGSGKTFQTANLINIAIDRNPGTTIRVCAPSNAAVAQLRRAIAVDGEIPHQVTISTCHRAFKRLQFTAAGEAVLAALVSGDETLTLGDRVDATAAELMREWYAKARSDEAAFSDARSAAISAQRKAEEAGATFNAGQTDEVIAIYTPQAIAKLMRGLRPFDVTELDSRFVHWADDPEPAKIFIIDEVSMVPRSLIRRALSMGALVVLIGDRMQLEPVSLTYTDAAGRVWPDEPALAMLDGSNTACLQRSRRTGAKSSIPDVVARALYAPKQYFTHGLPVGFDADAEICVVRSMNEVPSDILRDDCAAIAFTNRCRGRHAMEIRRRLGMPKDHFGVGERLIISDIDRESALAEDLALAKDEQLTVRAFREGEGALWDYQLERADGSQFWTTLRAFDREGFKSGLDRLYNQMRGVDRPDYFDSPGLAVTTGFALTSHKAQGSQFKTAIVDRKDICHCGAEDCISDQLDVLPFDDGSLQPKWRRLLYVAGSRARERLIIIGA